MTIAETKPHLLITLPVDQLPPAATKSVFRIVRMDKGGGIHLALSPVVVGQLERVKWCNNKAGLRAGASVSLR